MGIETSKCVIGYPIENVLCDSMTLCTATTHENSHVPYSYDNVCSEQCNIVQKTYKDPRVKLFYRVYYNQIKTSKDFEERLENSWSVSPIDTLRIIFHFRDISRGHGMKNTFKEFCLWLYRNHADALDQIFIHIPYYGTWKDLQRIFCGTLYEHRIIKFHAENLRESLNLLKNDEISQIDFGVSKYAPTEGSEYDKKYKLVSKFIRELGVTKNEYRKNYLRPLRSINPSVEELMCSGRWNDIDFSKVSHKAFIKYQNTFKRRCPEKYYEYIRNLTQNEKKFDDQSSLVYIICQYLNTFLKNEEYEKRWTSIYENFEKDEEYMLCIPDTDYLMYAKSKKTSFREISVSLAMMVMTSVIYNENSPLYRKYFNFSNNPSEKIVNGKDLHEMINVVEKNFNKGDIDFTKLYDNILEFILNNCLQKAPKSLIIISHHHSSEILSLYENVDWNAMEEKYTKHGFVCPPIVYWKPYQIVKEPYINIDNIFFTIIQGYNPNILYHLLRYKSFEPYEFMRSIIDSDRYKKISI
jgi:hypothetical protein